MTTLVFFCAMLSGLTLTFYLRGYAISNKIIDIPNHRSSHSIPTPRGGGVAFVVTFIVGVLALYLWKAHFSTSLFLILFFGSSLIALVGFFDDLKHIPAKWRLLGHFVIAFFAVVLLGGFPSIEIFGFNTNFHIIGYFIGSLFIVWLINLYNFMDGIDGLAASEAVFVCISGFLLYSFIGQPLYSFPLLLLAGAVAGFLVLNFPPAKIFMGDAGSGFLGFALGVLCLQAAFIDASLFWAWLVLLGVFIVDATLTLFRRLFFGLKVYEAHRTHAYQYASRHLGSHLPVTMSIFAINLLWLLPIAYLVVDGLVPGAIGLVVAYLPLIFLAVKFRAGIEEL